jgi:hypothetical protein
MNRIMKFAMAAVIALVAGGAQAQTTGKTVLGTNANAWDPGLAPYAGSPEVSAKTGTFHAGGVAACDGCHVMHNANNGVARSTKTAPWTNAVPAFLLQGADQSSTCLMCHGDSVAGWTNNKPYVMTNTGGNLAATNYSPGGDFGWLKSSFTQSPGASHGHSVAAIDFGMSSEPGRIAPGGTFAGGAAGMSQFACSSCHDPHGRYRIQGDATWTWTGPEKTGLPAITQPIWSSGSYGNVPRADAAISSYRLLAGRGYVPASSIANPFPFVNNPPVAIAPANYNKSEAGSGANKRLEVRVAYGSGMSEWCQNCHTNIHMDNYMSGAMGGTGLRHPAGQGAVLKPGQFDVYNKYVSSGRFGGTGDQYTSLVPFEVAARVGYNGNGGTNLSTILGALEGAAANGAASDTFGIFVASGQSNVMCLSCHRAHASAFSSAVRWNADDTFITNSSTTTWVDTQARTNAGLTAGYYGRTPVDMGVFQRSLCNKCHAKD